MSNWYNISRERRARIRAEVAGQVRKEVTDELEPVLREQIEEELWDRARQEAQEEIEEAERLQQEAREDLEEAREEAKAEARDELERRHRLGAPSERLRQGFIEFVKETELDCHAQAVVASGTASGYHRRLRWSRRLRGPLPWVLFTGAVPALYAVFLRVGSYDAPAFIAAAAGLLVAFLTILISNAVRHGRFEDKAQELDRAASDYLIMAERAKSYRLVHAERLETKGRLDELTQRLRAAKVKLDQRFHPPVDELDAAKDSVRHRISVDAVDLDADFKERLAEAEAEAAEEAVEHRARA